MQGLSTKLTAVMDKDLPSVGLFYVDIDVEKVPLVLILHEILMLFPIDRELAQQMYRDPMYTCNSVHLS